MRLGSLQQGGINLAQPVNWSHPLNRGLVSWWMCLPGDGRKGFRWLDLCGKNHGVLTNMDPATDWVGGPGGRGALDFDGSDDHILVTKNIPVDSQMTVAICMDADVLTSLRAMTHKGSAASEYNLWIRSNGTHLDYLWRGTGGDNVYRVSSILSTGTPTHIVVTHRSGETPKVYVHGIERSGSIVSGSGSTALTDVSHDFHIGSRGDGQAFDGRIQVVKIANRFWSAADVASDRERWLRGYPGLLNRVRRYWLVPSVSSGTAPTITSALTAEGFVGTAFSYQITATGDPASFTYGASNLPAGLSVNTSTGEISGTPTEAVYTADTPVVITADNGVDPPDSANLVITIWELAETTAADAETVQRTGLEASTTYKSFVVAFNAAGESDRSNEQEVTTAGSVFALDAQPASFSLTGVDASFLIGYAVDAQPASFSFAGIAAALETAYTINAEAAAFASNAFDAQLELLGVVSLDAQAATFSVTADDAQLVAGLTLSVDAAAFSITGVDAEFLVDSVIDAQEATFGITGVDAQLTALGAPEIDAQPATFSITGIDVSLISDQFISNDPASFTLTGIDVSLVAGYTLDAEITPFAYTPTDSSLIADRTINAQTTSYALAGVDAEWFVERVLSLDSATFVLTGVSAELLLFGTFILDADQASFSVSAIPAQLPTSKFIDADPADFEVSGQLAEIKAGRVLQGGVAIYTISGVSALLRSSGEIPSGSTLLLVAIDVFVPGSDRSSEFVPGAIQTDTSQ